MKKMKKSVWIVVLCVCIAVVLGAVIYLFHNMTQKEISRDDFTATQDSVSSESVPVDSTSGAASNVDAPDATEKPPVFSWGYQPMQLGDFTVSFDELMAINPDIYAWIYIPNTNVDYPVARSTRDGNDSFYLEHNIYRQYQFSGTIYSEIKNQPDMRDRVTVMYGHNMLNGSMFASLHNFEDKTFFDQNNTIFVLTKDKVFTYLVYSAYTYDDRHILNSYYMDDDASFLSYLDSTLHPHSYNGNVREGVSLTKDNKILTLSTCTDGAANTRYLVQGVLIDESSR